MPRTHSLTHSQTVSAPFQATVRSQPVARDDDKLLLRRLAHGERAALATIYDRHGGTAFSLAHRMCGTRAGGVVEAAFLALWRQARAGQGVGPVRSRLLRITRQRALALLNDGDRIGHRATAAESGPRAPSLIGLGDGDARAALEALPSAERQCIELAYFHGLSVAEIASRTRLPPAAVSDRLSRGMDRLHGVLVAGVLTLASRETPSFSQ